MLKNGCRRIDASARVKINLGSKTEKKFDIFLIPVLTALQVQKAISYHLTFDL
jgi:hypothetical protein